MDGVQGLFRSDDTGASWVRINDDQHQYGNMGEALTGDPRIYGRVYLGTNGRGIIYGDRTGGSTPSPSPSPSASPTRSPSPSPSASPSTSPSPSPSPSPSASPSRSPSPSPSPSASPSGGKACSATYTVVNQWPGGFQGEVTVTNTGGSSISGWSVKWAFANGQTISQLWNGTVSQSGANVTVTNVSYNGSVGVGASTTFGFQASWNGTNAVPSPVTCTAS